MAEIGLIDVDGHNYPNLALMRISAFHKAQGDHVEWWLGNLKHYDIVYMSKIFSDAYSQEKDDVWNAVHVIRGGTGYCISNPDGREVFDKSKNINLPDEVESMIPDYTLYPDYEFAVAMTSRGCPRGCAFCHVAPKEGRCSHKVANLDRFYTGQKHIEVLDPNILACKQKRDLLQQYRDVCKNVRGVVSVNFNQGLDIRVLNGEDMDDINAMKIKGIHFAWDNPDDDLKDKFKLFADNFRYAHKGTVYTLVNFNSTMEQNLYRIYTLWDMGYDPYVMIYDKPHASKEIRLLQRWCNNVYVRKKCRRFEDYDKSMYGKKYQEYKRGESNE